MLSINAAIEKIISSSQVLDRRETLALTQALGRILACDQVATVNVPPADNTSMDGYALHTASLKGEAPWILPVSQTIKAGDVVQALQTDSAARIFTGGEIPEGANTVVIQEDCDALAGRVRINRDAVPRDNIRPKGQDIAKGDCVLKAGQYLRPQDIGLLASIGISTVEVYQTMTVAILNTGNELVLPGKSLQQGQIYNSNYFMLRALLEKLGCRVLENKQHHVMDNLEQTQSSLNTLSEQADLIITTGGASVGDEDHITKAIESQGELTLWKIHVKPGKPLAFGRIGNTPIFGLPGNPVSVFVTFLLFVRPFLFSLQGRSIAATKSLLLPAQFHIARPRARPEYARGRISSAGVELYPNQNSGVLSSVSWADSLVFIPHNTTIEKNTLVETFPIENFYS